MTQIETYLEPEITSKQNPTDLLVILAIMAVIFGFFLVLFIG